MLRKFTILGSVLLIAGAAMLGWVFAEKRREERRAAEYELKYGSETSEYLERYNEWLQLPPEERAHLPLGSDEYGKTKAQIRQEQRERLEADLNKLATDEMDVHPFADVLYGENWEEELAKYKKRREMSELAFTVSILCAVMGGAIVGLSLSVLAVRLLIRGSSALTRFASNYVRGLKETKGEQPAQDDAKAKAKMRAKGKAEKKVKAEAEARAQAKAEGKDQAEAERLARAEEKARAKAEAKEKARAEAEAKAKAKAEREAQAKAERLARAEEKARAKVEAKEKARVEAEVRAKAKAERKAQAEAERLARAEEKARAKVEAVARAKAEAEEKILVEEQRSQARLPAAKVEGHSREPGNSGWRGLELNSAKQAEKMAVLLSDEKSIDLEESLRAATENVNMSLKLKDSLKAQTESLEKQMAEFKQMTQSAQQTAAEQSDPINSTLTELTQQVAAIREYAAGQQGRLEKLQDGYDWNIIKTFCLRVIRCVDNLESRISRLSEQNAEAGHLEEIKDELIFALESSGIEQFKPEINSDYRGQEKYAEAVKEKESCDDPKRKGKIAEVIRPGYQYFIDEENVRVVRPAQVRLFA